MKPLFAYLRHYAQATPNKPAIIYYGKEITYKELDELSDRFAAYLVQSGIGKGDKVALFMQNCPQYIICSYGIQKIGAIVGPCSPMFKEWELEYEVNDLGAKVIVALDSLYPIVEQVREKTALTHVILTNYEDFLPSQEAIPTFPDALTAKQAIAGTEDLAHLLQQSYPALPEVEIDLDSDVCLIVYTSGSTGMPKGAMLTYRNALHKTSCVARTYGYTPDDIHLCVMPVFHIAGQLFSSNSPIYSGGTIVLLTRYSAAAVMEAIERYGVTSAYTTVPMNVEIMNHPRSKDTNFTTLKLNPCTSFGIPLNEDIAKAWKDLTGAILHEMSYGLSETHTGDSLMPPDAIRYGSFGRPTYDTTVRIVSLDDPTVVLPAGEAGEITVKGPGVFKGYLNKPEATEDALRDGWLYTGDIGVLDEDGYLYFQGRKKEMIKCSGYSVFPEEVEQMLIRHPAISAAAVIGVPDSTRGESVKAFVVLKEGFQDLVTTNEIVAWSKEKMATYKYPRFVEIRTQLPATGTGKLLRRILSEEEKAKREEQNVNG